MTDDLSASSVLESTYATTALLRSRGVSARRLASLVATGVLLRVRRGRLVDPALPSEVLEAARMGGQLDCVTLLSSLGVFVRARPTLHVRFRPATSRLPARGSDVVAHWRDSVQPERRLTADIVEALAQSCLCQSPTDAIATLDSALHLRFIDATSLAEVFARLPDRMQNLRSRVDGRSESGAETIVRLILDDLGATYDVQVSVRGVGRVDFVVNDWLIIECDSEAHHAGWTSQKRDRRRDLAAATLGYTTIRPIAEDILYREADVRAQLADALSHGHVRSSTHSSLLRPTRRSPRSSGPASVELRAPRL